MAVTVVAEALLDLSAFVRFPLVLSNLWRMLLQ